MGGQEKDVREEIKKLIKESCYFDKQPSDEFQKFHKIFLKFSFGALDIQLDYEANSILIWNSKPSTGNSIELQDFNESMFGKVNYTNLEETLLGCVEMGMFNERFYKHLLYEFDRLPNEDGMKIA